MQAISTCHQNHHEWVKIIGWIHITYRYIDPSRHNFENCLLPWFSPQSCLSWPSSQWPAQAALMEKSWKEINVSICDVDWSPEYMKKTKWKKRILVNFWIEKQKNNSSSVVIPIIILLCFTVDVGSVALLWQNVKCNVNPRLSHFEGCASASARLLANLHLHFVFCQSKATLPYLPMHSLQLHDNFWFKASNSLCLNGDLPSMKHIPK